MIFAIRISDRLGFPGFPPRALGIRASLRSIENRIVGRRRSPKIQKPRMLKMFKIKLLKDGCSSWSVLWVVMKRHKSAMGGELPRTFLKLEPKVIKDLEEEKYRPKKHPGRFAANVTQLPSRFVDAARLLLQDQPKNRLTEEARALSQYLFSRKAPSETDDLAEKAREVQQSILLKDPRLGQPTDNEEDKKLQENKLKQKVMMKLRTLTYNWQPMKYDASKGLVYLLIRSAPEYAVLTTILREIRLRCKDFKPESVLDFGSGVGTVFWASYGQFGENMKEYFAVDISADMNNIAQLLVQDGSESKRPILKGTFFRQFLPATHILNYDLVVSAYSLMELPSRELRLQTLENLWSKTNQFLIVVEQGTNAGYRLVMEARDFILQASSDDAHVFAPCSHDMACPKIPIGIPCNFQAGYFQLDGKGEEKHTERYCYVVLRKRRRPEGEPWPRVASLVLPRGEHVVCRMCCGDGRLKETVVTAAKHGKPMYKCARASRWGDLLPASTVDPVELEPCEDDPEIVEEKCLDAKGPE